MSALRLDAALALLVEADLLKDIDARGRTFEVAPGDFRRGLTAVNCQRPPRGSMRRDDGGGR